MIRAFNNNDNNNSNELDEDNAPADDNGKGNDIGSDIYFFMMMTIILSLVTVSYSNDMKRAFIRVLTHRRPKLSLRVWNVNLLSQSVSRYRRSLMRLCMRSKIQRSANAKCL